MRIFATAIIFAMLSSSALAASDKDADDAAPKKEKRVCRKSEPTGSRLTTRVCHSQAEWDAIDRAEKERADREVDRIQAMSTSGGSGYNPN